MMADLLEEDYSIEVSMDNYGESNLTYYSSLQYYGHNASLDYASVSDSELNARIPIDHPEGKSNIIARNNDSLVVDLLLTSLHMNSSSWTTAIDNQQKWWKLLQTQVSAIFNIRSFT